MRLRASVRRVTGKARNWWGIVETEKGIKGKHLLPPARHVEIIEEDKGFLMLLYDEKGEWAGDGWHPTLQEAKQQARFEFEIEEGDWKPF